MIISRFRKIYYSRIVVTLILLPILFLLSLLVIHKVIPDQKSIASGSQIYWGATIEGSNYGDGFAPWDTNSITAFQTNMGKNISILNFGEEWYSCPSSCSYNPFPTSQMNTVRNLGIIPFFTWGSDNSTNGYSGNQSQFTLASIINGNHDTFLTQWATDAKNWGHPLFLRFDWEMNGNWYPLE